MSNKNKLELTWIGKDNPPKLEPRILIEDPELSYRAERKVTDNDIFDNKIIFGDNLLALKALEEYRGKVKCVFIDPPYNTGSAFQYYDDGIEHSLWLTLIKSRIDILKNLLSDEGSIWITIDDNEAHYLKVLCDEIFGRHNFVANVIWEKADSPKMDAKLFSSRHDHVLIYAKDINKLKFNKIPMDTDELKHYNKVDENGIKYYLKPLRAMGADGNREARPTMYYSLTAPDNTEVFPKNADGSDSRWRWSPEKTEKEKDRIEWVKGKKGWTAYYRVYAKENASKPPETIWFNNEVGTNRTSKAEIKALFKEGKPFETPKPEKLLERILTIATDPYDIVLDSFAGSGTTGAVAHKMGRKWIMIELGEHCHTHVIPRLKQVIDGTDQGGISKAVNWHGGGGFKYYRLAPSLLEKDKFGNWIISSKYNAAMLAEAMCKHKGFTYAPDENVYWKQGHSTENDYIYTTTQFITREVADSIQEQMQEDETLLICCKAFTANPDDYPNITFVKIPTTILRNCEYGKDDYSLNVDELIQDEDKEQLSLFVEDDSNE